MHQRAARHADTGRAAEREAAGKQLDRGVVGGLDRHVAVGQHRRRVGRRAGDVGPDIGVEHDDNDRGGDAGLGGGADRGGDVENVFGRCGRDRDVAVEVGVGAVGDVGLDVLVDDFDHDTDTDACRAECAAQASGTVDQLRVVGCGDRETLCQSGCERDVLVDRGVVGDPGLGREREDLYERRASDGDAVAVGRDRPSDRHRSDGDVAEHWDFVLEHLHRRGRLGRHRQIEEDGRVPAPRDFDEPAAPALESRAPVAQRLPGVHQNDMRFADTVHMTAKKQ